MMFFSDVIFVLSFLNILQDFHVSSCDHNCADKPVFSPSELVVKYGDPASATCFVCQHECHSKLFDIESAVGQKETNGTNISWTVDRLTAWELSLLCYHNNASDYQCCTYLPVTLYKPPDNVSISFENHSGPMKEGRLYTLKCTVLDVAPVESLTVILYRGDIIQATEKFWDFTEKKPRTVDYTFDIIPQMEEDGAEYWCAAELELGPEGPQPPPVVRSQKVPTTVYYKPQLKGSSLPEPITITEGDKLQLDCSAVGNPSPTYNWMLPSHSHSPSRSNILIIESVTVEHGGKYTCIVSNGYWDPVTVDFNVDVRGNYIGYILAVIFVLAVLLVIAGVIIYTCVEKTFA
uniref:vascular cell adhesion protein 1-like n=1 Tax=Semicossyphus pulcher TaxID=241346 RepID=UPI0037E994EB